MNWAPQTRARTIPGWTARLGGVVLLIGGTDPRPRSTDRAGDVTSVARRSVLGAGGVDIGMSTTTHRSSAGSRERLATDAALLRALHQIGDPLVLVNVWDAESARRVERSGGRAVATSSAAVAASLGLADGNTMPPAAAFDALGRIAAAVAVPVTADLESGYGLSADELVDRLLAAGGVGLNLEDSDHGRPGELIEAAAAAERLAAVRESATNSGVDVVVNARVDTYLHRGARTRSSFSPRPSAGPGSTWTRVRTASIRSGSPTRC